MDVSVIIVNYNTINLLCKAIESILKHTESVSFEIIVVDNASNDNSQKIIEEKFGSRVIFIALPENIGFGGANNEAVKRSKGRNLFFLNPDTTLLNNVISILSSYIDVNPDTAIAGGNIYDNDLNPSYSYRRFLPSVFWEMNDLLMALPEKILYGKNAFFNRTGEPVVVAYITGADLMISRENFIRAGCFDPDFFLYFEESDLAKRVRNMGYHIKSVPQAEIIHLEGSSFSDNISRSALYFKSKIHYHRKHFSKFKLGIINVIILTTFISRILAFSILRNKNKIIFWRSQYHAFISARH